MAALIWDNFEETINIEQGAAIKAAEKNQSRKIAHDKAVDWPPSEPADTKAEKHRGNKWEKRNEEKTSRRRKYTVKRDESNKAQRQLVIVVMEIWHVLG